MKRILALLILASAISGFAQQSQQSPRISIDQFFDNFTAEWIRANPNTAAATRYFSGEQQDRFERQLTPETVAFRHERIKLARKGLAELRQFDRTKLSSTQRLSADLMEWQLDTVTREEPFLDYSFPLNQFNGVNVNLVETLTVRRALSNERDALNYVTTLGQVGIRIHEAVVEANRLAAKNLMPPRFIIRATITQMKQFIAAPPNQNPFVTTYEQRMGAVGSMSAARRTALRDEAIKIVSSQVYPAWQSAISMLESIESRATDDAGISRFTGGSEAYAYFLHRFTTTNLTADQIHEIGLRRVAEIEQQMDAILRQLGRTQGSVKERVEKLKSDLAYPRTDDGRIKIMADVDQILKDAEKRSQSLSTSIRS